MTSFAKDKLYALLPAIYRQRDAEGGEPLRALISVLAAQASILEQDIANLYDNWFIETADEWLAPYIGDLLGVHGLHPVSGKIFSHRAQVANTLGYRRRKGTATMLEQLARHTTGWDARVVEFFELLETMQHFNHIRLANARMPDLRLTNSLELLDTPFDSIAHTADVRHIDKMRGLHNIPNIGIFLWRLRAYPIPALDAFVHGGGRFSFSPLGNDLPLFNLPQTETTITHLAEEINVPDRLRRRALYDDLEAVRQALVDSQAYNPVYFNQQPVFKLYLPGQTDPIPLAEILICNLNIWREPPASLDYRRADGAVASRPITVAVDPLNGRIAFRAAQAPASLQVSYAYGFSGDLGSGPYDRRRIRSQAAATTVPDTIADPEVFEALIHVPSAGINTIADALSAWDPAVKRTVIQIEDNRTYPDDLSINMAGSELVIQAKNYQRPVITGDVTINGGIETSRLTLNGLLIAGEVLIANKSGTPPALGSNDASLIGGATTITTQPDFITLANDATGGSFRLLLGADATGDIAFNAPAAKVQAALEQLPGISNFGYVTVSGAPQNWTVEFIQELNELNFIHGTLVPGHALGLNGDPQDATRPALVVDAKNDHLRLTIDHSIVGPLKIPAAITSLTARDSIIDAPQSARPALAGSDDGKDPGPVTTLERVTIFGAVHVREFELVSDTLFMQPAVADRRQAGCVRFSFVPKDSQLPRRYRCQPEYTIGQRIEAALRENPQLAKTDQDRMEADVRGRLWPTFTDLRYGQPGYAQLGLTCPLEIRTGASDEAEMGAFNFLQQPQREANLRSNLNEYLRFGLEAGISFVT